MSLWPFASQAVPGKAPRGHQPDPGPRPAAPGNPPNQGSGGKRADDNGSYIGLKRRAQAEVNDIMREANTCMTREDVAALRKPVEGECKIECIVSLDAFQPTLAELLAARRTPEMTATAKVGYSPAKWAALLAQTVEQIEKLSTLKGGEYAGDDDRLANFRRNGANLGLPMETVWAVYAAKHWDAVSQFIKDLNTGKSRERLEPIAGRVDDLIVYLLLFKAMLDERNMLD